jgi:hypothetical protein
MKQINEQYILKAEANSENKPFFVLYKTHGKWPNGELFEKVHPDYIKDWPDNEPTAEEIQHELMLNDWSRWNTELPEGQKVEVSEFIYYSLLECLPPRIMESGYFEVGEPHSHDNKGRAIHRACWMEQGKYFTGYPKA